MSNRRRPARASDRARERRFRAEARALGVTGTGRELGRTIAAGLRHWPRASVVATIDQAAPGLSAEKITALINLAARCWADTDPIPTWQD